AVQVATACLDAGAGRLGTALVSEALELREAGVTAPILAWIITPGQPLDEAARQEIELSAGAPWAIDAIAAAARRTGHRVRVHLKVDTGMSRGGAAPGDWPSLVKQALAV